MSRAAAWHPSPNFGPRRDTDAPDMIVLHYTAMRSAPDALTLLCDPAREVSAHYLIGADGHLWQMVREADRAWHAGAGSWAGARDVNSRSIGIELSNTGATPFAAPQMAALEALLRDLMARWAIRPEAVVAHSDTALGRKIDPGPRFDWRRLARQGLSVWPEPAAPGQFLQDCGRFGYDCAEGGEEDLLHAVRLRFRPWATGRLDDTDRAIMADLAARYPARRA
ncbi:N-acetylmuramoyl-L-alanine amidase [Pseudoponticoccus marisrubri]|uniref:N-acetylmuramoyl-L-alanine amidase n=1 Tax=Pseudoponticoccus marisrubri TaxID=1685382 RepID=A0A0W7WN73_9RHOB|nr:N-acetylmuramoyl-L-alanine amidase [Pseudoponticoccus marisrubri]KUF12041.1 N-acetylmuramoyl-L-alanine amidase [Pseudoponticoccus marisrubri]